MKESNAGLLMVLPGLAGLLVLTYGPVLASVGLSFTHWNLLSPPSFVGLDNYAQVLSDPLFWKTFVNSWVFVGGTAVLEVALGLLLALGLSRPLRGLGFLRAAYFVPYVTPMIGVTLVWGWMLDPTEGLLNQGLHWFGLAGVPWLQRGDTAMASAIVLQVWRNVGYAMLLFLAALQALPGQVTEAALLDGASPWQRFRHVTLPLLAPMIAFIGLMALIRGFQVFDSVYLLTQGGPNHDTEVMVLWLYKNAFEYFRVGPASAIAYLLFLTILALTLVQNWLKKRLSPEG
jgi:multiple sugar transport system permease protein